MGVSERRNMKQFIVLIAVHICVFTCAMTTEEDCPAGFEKVEGIKNKCFHYYTRPFNSKGQPAQGVNGTLVMFKDALEICEGKNATVVEPRSREEGDMIYKYVREKNGPIWDLWINYRDIAVQVSFEGKSDRVFKPHPTLAVCPLWPKCRMIGGPQCITETHRLAGTVCIGALVGLTSQTPMVCTDARANPPVL